MANEHAKKLRPKYIVTKLDPTNPHNTICGTSMVSTDPDDVDSPFVLMPRKDPAAFAAMLAYAQCCEPNLALEIDKWLEKIAQAEPSFGTQGIRNFQATRMAAIGQR